MSGGDKLLSVVPAAESAATVEEGRSPHRVVIVGGGFAGLEAAKAMARLPVEVELVDRRNHHLFQPLLYQVATGALSPGDISMPLRKIFARHSNVRVLMSEARDIDPERRVVVLADRELPYDSLVVATGARHAYFGNPQWEEIAPGLKTIEDATTIRARILSSFERAELADDDAERERLLTFVVVGAGPTGVELAGAIGELAAHTLAGEFRNFDPARVKVLLVEGQGRVLPPYPEELSVRAEASLRKLGVTLLTGTVVTELDAESVTLQRGEERWRVAAGTILWAAGVEPSKLARVLERRAGAELDRAGRVKVDSRCSLPQHPDILVLGDLSHFEDATGRALPGTSPVAMQQGRYAARRVADRLAGRESHVFRYRNRGSLAVIGRAAAVADLGRARFSGLFAWLLWLFVHIMYLVGFANRVLVIIQWAHSYWTRGRGARLITGPWKPGGP
jgi:NADH dehydrogenase